MRSLRPLLWFWATIASLVAGAAVVLQIMGPVTRAASRAVQARMQTASQPPAAAAPLSAQQTPAEQTVAQPAHIPPSRLDPAPPLKMATSVIPAPDPALQEPVPGEPDRKLPRSDARGRQAATLYAAAFDTAERHPRVTLVIDGAGLDRGLTAQANRTLPAAVDFAYSAYAPLADANAQAALGRRLGRECLVSIPMEPNGYPSREEGNRALLTGAEPAQIQANLNYALSGVQGCVGATGASDGMQGERFAQSTQIYADLLTELARRGLLYLDPRPGAPLPPDDVPGRHLPYVADLIVDEATSPEWPADSEAIDRNLARLEQIAARRGGAIGIAGPPTPVLLDRVLVWSRGLAARGLVLAPLTANPVPSPPNMEAAR